MKRVLVNLAVSITIGALFVWLAARGVDWDGLRQAFAALGWLHLLGYFVILSVVQLVRIFRWGILLRPLGTVHTGELLAAGSVGFMALILLPLRLGEFARPLLIARRGGIRASAALATVVIERVVDALAMAGLLAIMLFVLGSDGAHAHSLRLWAYIIFGGFLLLLVLLLLAYRFRNTTANWIHRLLRPLSLRLAGRAASILDSFIGGLHALPDRRLLAGFLAMTVFYWCLSGLGLVYMFQAFKPLAGLGLVEGYTALSVLCVGLMIPAGPGMIGNFHYFLKAGLGLFVAGPVLASTGLAYAITVHAMQLGQQVVWGLLFLFTGQVSAGNWLPLFANRSSGDRESLS